MKEQADLSQRAASELKMMVMTRKNDDDDKEDDDYAIFQEQYKVSLKSGRRVAITMMMMAKTIATSVEEQLARWR